MVTAESIRCIGDYTTESVRLVVEDGKADKAMEYKDRGTTNDFSAMKR